MRRVSVVFALLTSLVAVAAEGKTVAVTIHYNAVVVTKITCEDSRGKRFVHRPALGGVFRAALAPGPAKVIYQLGETYPSSPRVVEWFGAGFTASDKGITGNAYPLDSERHHI